MLGFAHLPSLMRRASKLKSLPRPLEAAPTLAVVSSGYSICCSLRCQRRNDAGSGQSFLPAARNSTKQDLARPVTKQALEIMPERAGEFVFLYRLRQHGDPRVFKIHAGIRRAASSDEQFMTSQDRTDPHESRGVSSGVAERCLDHVMRGRARRL